MRFQGVRMLDWIAPGLGRITIHLGTCLEHVTGQGKVQALQVLTINK